MHHPYFEARGTVRQIEDPVMGPLAILGLRLRFSAQPKLWDLETPLLGQHNAQVLEALLGYSAAEVADLVARGVLKSPLRSACSMFPICDDNPQILTPYANWAIVALNIAVWCLVQGFGGQSALAKSMCTLGLAPGELLGLLLGLLPAWISARICVV